MPYAAIQRNAGRLFHCVWYRRRSGSVVDSLALGHHTTADYHRQSATTWIYVPKARYTLPKRISDANLKVRA